MPKPMGGASGDSPARAAAVLTTMHRALVQCAAALAAPEHGIIRASLAADVGKQVGSITRPVCGARGGCRRARACPAPADPGTRPSDGRCCVRSTSCLSGMVAAQCVAVAVEKHRPGYDATVPLPGKARWGGVAWEPAIRHPCAVKSLAGARIGAAGF